MRQQRQADAQAALNTALTTSLWWLRSSLANVIIHKFRSSTIPTSIQCIILHCQHACLLDHSPHSLHGSLQRPCPIRPSHRVPSADRARNSTPSRHASQTRESVTPCNLKPLLSPRHLSDASPTAVQPLRFTQLPLDTGFNRSSFVMGINSPLIVLRHTRSISPHNSESCVDGLVLIHRAQIHRMVLFTP